MAVKFRFCIELCAFYNIWKFGREFLLLFKMPSEMMVFPGGLILNALFSFDNCKMPFFPFYLFFWLMVQLLCRYIFTVLYVVLGETCCIVVAAYSHIMLNALVPMLRYPKDLFCQYLSIAISVI